MRKSKYVGMKSGEWVCVHAGIASVQSVFKKYERDALGRKVRSKSPGSKQYYYIFVRLTHDGICEKMVRLNAAQALAVRKGLITVEEIADKKKSKNSLAFKEKVSYSFLPGC